MAAASNSCYRYGCVERRASLFHRSLPIFNVRVSVKKEAFRCAKTGARTLIGDASPRRSWPRYRHARTAVIYGGEILVRDRDRVPRRREFLLRYAFLARQDDQVRSRGDKRIMLLNIIEQFSD